MEKIRNYINGKLAEPKSGRYIDNYEPATGKVYSLIPDSGADDVEEAVCAAKVAFPSWSNMPVAQRSAFLLRISGGTSRNRSDDRSVG